MTQRCKFCNEALNLDHAWTQAWVHIAGGSYWCATGNTHATPFDEADEAQAEYDKNPELQGLLTRAADSGRSTIRRRAATNSVLQERHERGFCSCAAISTEPCLLVAELDEDSAAPTLGDNIRMMRKLAGVSKPEAAEALGMDRKEFTKIEKGLRRATGAELADFAYFLDISPLAILEPDSLVGRVAASILEMRADGGREDATTARSPGTPAAALELSLDDLEWWARRDPRTGNEYDKRVRTAAREVLGLDHVAKVSEPEASAPHVSLDDMATARPVSRTRVDALKSAMVAELEAFKLRDRVEEIVKGLRSNGKGCTCSAWYAGECACDVDWPEHFISDAADLLEEFCNRLTQSESSGSPEVSQKVRCILSRESAEALYRYYPAEDLPHEMELDEALGVALKRAEVSEKCEHGIDDIRWAYCAWCGAPLEGK